MKVAVASSGLGHIKRGIETWAFETAHALQKHGVNVTLFAAAPLADSRVPTITLPARKRNAPTTRFIAKIMPRWTWRWHLKSIYAIEQVSFWNHLKKHLRKQTFDILHVQDPLLAEMAQRYFMKKKLPCNCILAHGTEEPASCLRRFTYLQHLAPWHLQQTLQILSRGSTPELSFPYWTVLPNFVDTDVFCPVDSQSDKTTARHLFQLPPDAIIWGTAAAIKRDHKRIDWLIQEFAAATKANPDLFLVIAGSRHSDTEALIEMANQRALGKISFMTDIPHAQMPRLLQTLDAFVLTSLFEMMPIAILEAISAGLPVYTHPHPVLAWMSGAGGTQIDMDSSGALQQCMEQDTLATLQTKGQKARQHAMDMFSMKHVIPAYIAYYHQICEIQSRK